MINTLPIGVLQRNLDSLFPQASLWPPAKRAALMQFRMATYTKVSTANASRALLRLHQQCGTLPRATRAPHWARGSGPRAKFELHSGPMPLVCTEAKACALKYAARANAARSHAHTLLCAITICRTQVFLKFKQQFWDSSTQFILQAPNDGASNMLLWQSLSPAGAAFMPGSNIIMMTVRGARK